MENEVREMKLGVQVYVQLKKKVNDAVILAALQN